MNEWKNLCEEIITTIEMNNTKFKDDFMDFVVADWKAKARAIAPNALQEPKIPMEPRTNKPYGATDTFTFGKHKGETVEDVIAEDAQYVQWADENVDFFKLKDDVKTILETTLNDRDDDYERW